MRIQPRRFRFSVILGAVSILLGSATASDPVPSEQSNSTSPLPLSTEVTRSKDSEFKRIVPKTAHWNGQDYDIETGINVLMTVIKNPTTSHDERALALRYLGNVSTRLRGEQCVEELVAIYPNLETTEEQYEVLLSFINSEDTRAFPLVYVIATSDASPRLRLRAAAALAQWNIRRGVQVLIELFPSEEKGPTRTVGADALMLFEGYNRRKGWGCPMEEIMKPATALSDQDYAGAVALAQRGFRDWFEQNKNRFPDWKPGDPLPEVQGKISVPNPASAP